MPMLAKALAVFDSIVSGFIYDTWVCVEDESSNQLELDLQAWLVVLCRNTSSDTNRRWFVVQSIDSLTTDSSSVERTEIR